MSELPEPAAMTAKQNLRNLFQIISMWILIGLAAAASVATILSAFNVIPWMPLGPDSAPDSALWLQITGTAVLVGLCAFLPSVYQIQRLERSHRDFKISMKDIATAYRMSHAADREGVFALSTEFEDVRARLEHARKHPDLGHLEPEILELAAQMSHMTRDLALVYSKDKVTRARDFLRQRQQELDTFNENLSLALTVTQELQRWQRDVEASELEANRQMDRLEKDLKEILPQLGYELDDEQGELPLSAPTDNEGKVIALSPSASGKSSPAADLGDLRTTGLDRPN
ncbi:hypothetical protein EDD53_0242 [Pacificibacter maritimus]|uniref:DNA repair protein n=1 Tax=Pacificibacter maritimus TaxID=762213 RepID=A0A3N4UUG8_9RHOB|nr:DNA repair protein [Pacificibacter maritimus]RPE71129.1 hypothetical protein EDD53_0242 [Pacificibacter maritimus]